MLTKELIEKEGWKCNKDSNIPGTFNKNNYTIFLNYKFKELVILNSKYHTLYDGPCEDINTFSYLCELLKINNLVD